MFLLGNTELKEIAWFPMYGFKAQLVEPLIGHAEVTGSNPTETSLLIFSPF